MRTGVLEIYRNGKLVNSFDFYDDAEVNKELAKIFVSKEARGTVTRISFPPYTTKMKVTQTFAREQGLYKYEYSFEGIER